MMNNESNIRPNNDGQSKKFDDSAQRQKGRVSFQFDLVANPENLKNGTSQSVDVASSTQQTNATLKAQDHHENKHASSIGSNNMMTGERPRMRVKVASCPANRSEHTPYDGNRRRELASTRRRVQSMPAGSLASQNFFGVDAGGGGGGGGGGGEGEGGRKSIDTSMLCGMKMEKVCEHHILGEENRCEIKQNKEDEVTKQNTSSPPKSGERVEVKKVEAADAIPSVSSPAKIATEGAQKCSCIIL